MCEVKQGVRRGAVLLLQAGDPEISGALAEGIMAGRAAEEGDLIRPASGAALVNQRLPTSAVSPERRNRQTQRVAALRATFPIEGRLLENGRQAGKAELARGVKEAVGNKKGPEDYALLRFEAELEYGESLYEPGPMARLAEALLGAYALTVYRLHEFFRRERKSATSGQHIWLCGRVAATGRHGLGQPTDWEGSRWHGR